ncbi:MAG TPA: hypothetical protein VGM03_04130, partial [Phycisphaerae bacterium]
MDAIGVQACKVVAEYVRRKVGGFFETMEPDVFPHGVPDGCELGGMSYDDSRHWLGIWNAALLPSLAYCLPNALPSPTRIGAAERQSKRLPAKGCAAAYGGTISYLADRWRQRRDEYALALEALQRHVDE